MTKKININTNLRTNLPTASEYDLIIMTHQLLKTKEKFNTEVEENLSNVLNLLAPNGQLIIIERGNPIGYETIARARQIMLRPENYPDERVKSQGLGKKAISGIDLEKIAILSPTRTMHRQKLITTYTKLHHTLIMAKTFFKQENQYITN